jgi:glutamate/tyrosine decarboxylase-like PLP-dependent enzyme
MNLIDDFSNRAKKYLSEKDGMPVYPHPSAIQALQQLNAPLQEDPLADAAVLSLLDTYGSPATVKSSGGRYFGFVTGSSLQAAMGAKLLATVWDQNAALSVMSPVASFLEEVSGNWLVSLLGLPENTVTSFVTGATMANFTALAAARHALLKKQGWDVLSKGLFHAPEITVIAGDELHVSLLKALSFLGFGRERVVRVPVDGQGRMITERIPVIKGPAIICLQSGNVNTGAFDPLEEICHHVKNDSTWIHVDGAFGLWAAAAPAKRHLMKGIELADSWGTDAHKWLNVPYDCGFAFVKHKQILFEAMAATAAYLPETSLREPFQYVPEMSRQARGVAVWAALKSLGKKGLAELIQKNCSQAERFAQGLQEAGFSILNEIVLNQVLVNFGDVSTTQKIIREIQEDGTCWCGGTTWQGKEAMRISVSSCATTDDDVERSLEAMIRIARKNIV